MFKVFVVYEREPQPKRYARHVDIAKCVPGARFTHGKVFGSPFGRAEFAYYAEFEFPNKESFERALRSAEFQESGKDATDMGIPFKVHFAEVS